MSFSLMTLGIPTLSIDNSHHYDTNHKHQVLLCWVSLWWVSHNFIVILSVFILNVVMLSVKVPIYFTWVKKKSIMKFCFLLLSSLSFSIFIQIVLFSTTSDVTLTSQFCRPTRRKLISSPSYLFNQYFYSFSVEANDVTAIQLLTS